MEDSEETRIVEFHIKSAIEHLEWYNRIGDTAIDYAQKSLANAQICLSKAKFYSVKNRE